MKNDTFTTPESQKIREILGITEDEHRYFHAVEELVNPLTTFLGDIQPREAGYTFADMNDEAKGKAIMLKQTIGLARLVNSVVAEFTPTEKAAYDAALARHLTIGAKLDANAVAVGRLVRQNTMNSLLGPLDAPAEG